MEKWFIVHSLESFNQNPRMIGFFARTKADGSFVLDERRKAIPICRKILGIKPGDKVIYYCKGDSVLRGIYEITKPYYAKETRWPNAPFQFGLKPLIELKEPYNFKLLLSFLDLFKHLPGLHKWGMSLQGKGNSVKSLTDHDYELIKKSIIQSEKENSNIALNDNLVPGLPDLLKGKDKKTKIRIAHEVLAEGVKPYLEKRRVK